MRADEDTSTPGFVCCSSKYASPTEVVHGASSCPLRTLQPTNMIDYTTVQLKRIRGRDHNPVGKTSASLRYRERGRIRGSPVNVSARHDDSSVDRNAIKASPTLTTDPITTPVSDRKPVGPGVQIKRFDHSAACRDDLVAGLTGHDGSSGLVGQTPRRLPRESVVFD